MRRSFLAVLMLTAATTAFAAPAKAHEAWGAGTIDKVDTAARSIVVKQGAHQMTFAVAQNAQVLEGKTSRSFADLSQDVGHPVKVRYTMDKGTRLADRVEVTSRAAAHAAK